MGNSIVFFGVQAVGCVWPLGEGSPAQGHGPHRGVYTVGQVVGRGCSGFGMLPDYTLLSTYYLCK